MRRLTALCLTATLVMPAASAQKLSQFSTAQFMVDYGRPLTLDECSKLADIGFQKVGFVRRSREQGYGMTMLIYTRNDQQIGSALCRQKAEFMMLSLTDPFKKDSAKSLIQKVYDALPTGLNK